MTRRLLARLLAGSVNVKALVDIAAFAPEAGRSSRSCSPRSCAPRSGHFDNP
jgi:hypothetical protein